MEKQPNNHESGIERNWKVFYAQFGGKAIEMSQADTNLFKHHEDYRDYDLVQHPSGLYLRSLVPDLFEELEEHGFNTIYQEYPANLHEKAVDEYWEEVVVNTAESFIAEEEE